MNSSGLGPLAAFLSSATWAIGSARYSVLSKTESPYAVNIARAFVAFPLFCLFAFALSGGLGAGFSEFSRVNMRQMVWVSISVIASYGAGDILFLWSTRSLGIPAALAICSCYPLWTAVVGWIWEGERFGWLRFLGLVATLLGLSIVILSEAEGKKRVSPSQVTGIFLAFLTSIFWSLNGVAAAHLGWQMNVGVVNTLRMAVALVFCPIVAFIVARIRREEAQYFLPKGAFWRSLWIFVIEAFGGSLFFVYGMAHSPLSVGPALTALAPALSLPIVWVMSSRKPIQNAPNRIVEKLTFFRVLGVCMTVAGVCFLVAGI